MKPVIIFGTNSFARLTNYYFKKNTSVDIIAYTVQKNYITHETFMGKKVVPFEILTELYPPEKYSVFIALGINGANKLKADIYNICKNQGYECISYIDPHIHLPDEIQIGDNCIIAEGVLLGPYVKIGNNVTINPGSIITHDITIGDHCFIGANTTINGDVHIGDYSLLSSSSVLDDGVTLGNNCIVGPGMVVTKDMQEGEIYIANELCSSEINGSDLIDIKYARIQKKQSKIGEKYHSFPLTSIQEAYWVGQRTNAQEARVSTHLYLEIESTKLDILKLQKTWNILIERHPMLRTVVTESGMQKTLDEVPHYTIETTDMRGMPQNIQNQKRESIRSLMSHQVLDSSQWPLFYFRAILIDSNTAYIFLSFDFLMLDGRGLDILASEWFQLYNDPNIVLPKIESSFFEYIEEYKKLQNTSSYRTDVDYWHQRIPSFPLAPQLPQVQKLDKMEAVKFTRFEKSFSSLEWQTMQREIHKRGFKVTAVLLAAFTQMLRYWSENKSMTINISIVDKLAQDKKYNNVVGNFTSTLLLAVDVDENTTFEDHVHKLQKQLSKDLKHSAFGGIDVMRELAKYHDDNIDTTMPIVFTRHHAEGSKRGGSNPMSWLGNSQYTITQTPQVSIDFQTYESGDEFMIVWDVVEDLFPQGMIENMFSSFTMLLLKLITKPRTWSITPEKLQNIILPAVDFSLYEKLNDTIHQHEEKFLHSDFLAQVIKDPNKFAVICDNRKLTYLELEQESAVIANWLQANNIQNNELVAVVMAKNWEQIVAILGILRAGAAYLPLDPALPKERMHNLLNESNITFVLSIPYWDESIEWPINTKTYIVGGSCGVGSSHTLENTLLSTGNPDNLAYVIYTSGSTGSPKGVMISHENAVNTIDDIIQRFKLNTDDKLLSLSSLSFDLSVFDIFGMLSVGGTIVMPTLHKIKDPAHWSETIQEHKITLWNSVPPLMQLLSEYVNQQQISLESLRLILLSGDWIPLELPGQIRHFSKNSQIVSLGGATEASIWSIFHKIDRVDPSWKSIPYGTPLHNQHIYIYNDELALCPVWVPGEIYIGGKGVGLGYWNNEELTNKSFIKHPITGEYLYKTGDMGRMHPDGFIEFLGRKDTQLKIRGFRVEAGEVEKTLEKHPNVDRVIVLPEEIGREKNHLIAYVSLKKSHTLSPEELKRFAKEQLPDYMRPSNYVIVDAFPLSSNGKVDRKVLSQITNKQTQNQLNKKIELSNDDDILPRVMTCISEVLHTDNIRQNDNFFDLGATSIDVIRLINSLDQEFDLRLTADHIYNTSNLMELAETIYEKTNQNYRLLNSNSEPKISVKDASNAYKVILDPLERETFRDANHGLRTDLQKNYIAQLPSVEIDDTMQALLKKRKSYRHFSNRQISIHAFSKLFRCLNGKKEGKKYKYSYGSAGSLYPVQTYLYVKPKSIQDIEAGIYYYHPIEHKLIQVSRTHISGDIYDLMINRPIFEEASFAVFFIADLSAIEPLYGKKSIHFSTIEVGLMTQILEENAPLSDMGLCQIGELDFESIKEDFNLTDSHILLHSLLGGALE